jgi:hypothetical protein
MLDSTLNDIDMHDCIVEPLFCRSANYHVHYIHAIYIKIKPIMLIQSRINVVVPEWLMGMTRNVPSQEQIRYHMVSAA